MPEELNENQLYVIVSHGRLLRGIEDKLPEFLSAELVELQQRAGNQLADYHSWEEPHDYPDMTTNPEPLMRAEAGRVLNAVHEELAQSGDKAIIEKIMRSLGIDPESPERAR